MLDKNDHGQTHVLDVLMVRLVLLRVKVGKNRVPDGLRALEMELAEEKTADPSAEVLDFEAITSGRCGTGTRTIGGG